MKKIATALVDAGTEVTDLSVPGWVPKRENIAALAEKVEKLNLNEKDCVMLDLWSNSVYLGSDEEGFPVRPSKSAVDGIYHIPGSLQVAHKGVFQRILQDCTPLLDSAANAATVILIPFPRYLTGKCCENPSHITNFGDADYREEVCKFADFVPGAVAGILSLGKTKVYSLFDAIVDLDPTLTATTILADPSSWVDPVHLTRETYVKAAVGLLAKRAELTEANNRPRQRLDSIVPPISGLIRPGRGGPLPSWVTGTASRGGRVQKPGRGSSRPFIFRGRGWPRGGTSRGGFNRGGRPPRSSRGRGRSGYFVG
jgi:hypothetical protein